MDSLCQSISSCSKNGTNQTYSESAEILATSPNLLISGGIRILIENEGDVEDDV